MAKIKEVGRKVKPERERWGREKEREKKTTNLTALQMVTTFTNLRIRHYYRNAYKPDNDSESDSQGEHFKKFRGLFRNPMLSRYPF